MISKNETTDLDKLLQDKEIVTYHLNNALTNLYKNELQYAEKVNEFHLKTKWAEIEEIKDKGRITESLKTAYIDTQLKELVTVIKTEKNNIETLKNNLKVINSKIKAEMKYLDVFIKMED